jgi:hypothetical protein
MLWELMSTLSKQDFVEGHGECAASILPYVLEVSSAKLAQKQEIGVRRRHEIPFKCLDWGGLYLRGA